MAGVLVRHACHQVTIHEPIATPNLVNETEITWNTTPFYTAMCYAFKQTSREFSRSQQQHYELTQLLSLRFDATAATITPRMSVMFRGRRLRIIAVVNVNEGDREIWLKCSEFQ